MDNQPLFIGEPINPDQHFTGGECMVLVFDITEVQHSLPDLEASVRSVRSSVEKALSEHPDLNGGFEPAVLVFGKNLPLKLQDVLHTAGATMFDLALPGNLGRTREDFLNELDEAVDVHVTPRAPQDSYTTDEDPSVYYQPIRPNEPELIREYLRFLNGNDQA